MASYPSEIAQDAAYQSHTSRLTELWSLPRPVQGPNTNNNNNNNNNNNSIPSTKLQHGGLYSLTGNSDLYRVLLPFCLHSHHGLKCLCENGT